MLLFESPDERAKAVTIIAAMQLHAISSARVPEKHEHADICSRAFSLAECFVDEAEKRVKSVKSEGVYGQ